MFKQLSQHRSRIYVYISIPLFFFVGVLLGRTQNDPLWADALPPAPVSTTASTGTLFTSSDMWASPPTQLGTFKDPLSPQVVVSSSGVVHLVWENEGRLYHAWRDQQGQWHGPNGLFYGYTPSIALDSNDFLHLVYAANVIGNFEIYHMVFNGQRWTLPRNVSHTQGASYSPQIAVAPDGSLHVVWNDTTPGREVLYQAVLDGAIWVNAPLMAAWGKAPSIQIDNSLILHVLWQGKDAKDNTDVFYMAGKGSVWALPLNLSNSDNTSMGVQAVLDYADKIHAVWLENDPTYAPRTLYYVRYTYGRHMSWLRPQIIAVADSENAAIATSERGSYIHLWWSKDGRWWEQWRSAGSGVWSLPTPLTLDTTRNVLFRFATQNDSRIRVLWRVDSDEEDKAEIWYGEARTPVKQNLYFPRMEHNARISALTSP